MNGTINFVADDEDIRLQLMHLPRPLLWLITVLVDRDRLPELMHLVDADDIAKSWDMSDLEGTYAPPVDLLREVDNGFVKITGMPAADPLQRRPIPIEHLRSGEWNWVQSEINVPSLQHSWIGVEVHVNDVATASERVELRKIDMKTWLDRYPHWFKPAGKDAWHRVVGPMPIYRTIKDQPVWQAVGDDTVRRMVGMLHEVDPRIIRKSQ